MSKCIKCGSYAFNLYKEEIDQGGLCDVHYWQGRAHRAEALAEQPAQQQERVAFPNRYLVEREIERSVNHTGMHLNDAKERVTLPSGTLRFMLALIDRTSPQPAQRKPLMDWIAVSDRIPLEADGEVLVRMRDGRCEIAWATYWHGASNAFAQWTFRDPDEDEAPTHWMPIPAAEAAHGIKENT